MGWALSGWLPTLESWLVSHHLYAAPVRIKVQPDWVWPRLSDSGFRPLEPPVNQQWNTVCTLVITVCIDLQQQAHRDPAARLRCHCRKVSCSFSPLLYDQRTFLTSCSKSNNVAQLPFTAACRWYTHTQQILCGDWYVGLSRNEGRAGFLTFRLSSYLPATKLSRWQ